MYEEKIQFKNKSFLFYFENHFELAFVQETNLEISSLDSLNQLSESIVTYSLVASIIIGSYFKSALYHYLYDNRKEFGQMPINFLILIQALIQHSICLFMVTYYTTGLFFNITVSEHVDETWCNIPWYVQAFALGYRNFGSLGIAIFRLLLIKCNTWIKDKIGLKKLLLIILAASLILTTLCSIGFGMGNGPASHKQVTWNFCIGTSEKLREAAHNYSLLTGIVEPEYEFISEISVLVSLGAVAIELACYLAFFQHLASHDNSMLKKKVLNTGQVKSRRRENAITFLGQFYGFGVEVLLYVSLMYTLREKESIGYRVAIVVGVWLEFAIISIVEVMTSNNLREYLPHNVAVIKAIQLYHQFY